jgi:valyl-tRNA synthetase
MRATAIIRGSCEISHKQDVYDPRQVEREAQDFWESRGSFRVTEDKAKP